MTKKIFVLTRRYEDSNGKDKIKLICGFTDETEAFRMKAKYELEDTDDFYRIEVEEIDIDTNQSLAHYTPDQEKEIFGEDPEEGSDT